MNIRFLETSLAAILALSASVATLGYTQYRSNPIQPPNATEPSVEDEAEEVEDVEEVEEEELEEEEMEIPDVPEIDDVEVAGMIMDEIQIPRTDAFFSGTVFEPGVEDKTAKAVRDHERTLQKIIVAWANAKDQDAKAELRAQIHELVTIIFSIRMQAQQNRVARLKAEVEKVEEYLAKRQGLSDQIIERRVKELLRERDELNWDDNPSGAAGMPSMFGFNPAVDFDLQPGVARAVTEPKLPSLEPMRGIDASLMQLDRARDTFAESAERWKAERASVLAKQRQVEAQRMAQDAQAAAKSSIENRKQALERQKQAIEAQLKSLKQ